MVPDTDVEKTYDKTASFPYACATQRTRVEHHYYRPSNELVLRQGQKEFSNPSRETAYTNPSLHNAKSSHRPMDQRSESLAYVLTYSNPRLPQPL